MNIFLKTFENRFFFTTGKTDAIDKIFEVILVFTLEKTIHVRRILENNYFNSKIFFCQSEICVLKIVVLERKQLKIVCLQ